MGPRLLIAIKMKISIGNNMIPSAIWNKYAQVKLHEPVRRVQFGVFEKLVVVENRQYSTAFLVCE